MLVAAERIYSYIVEVGTGAGPSGGEKCQMQNEVDVHCVCWCVLIMFQLPFDVCFMFPVLVRYHRDASTEGTSAKSERG